MGKKEKIKISKTMSYFLRHQLQKAGFKMVHDGFVDLGELMKKLKEHLNKDISEDIIREIVASDAKKRYTIIDGKIRANYGHSVSVNIDYHEKKPPKILYHGTSIHQIEKIKTEGIRSMNRNYVHLSTDIKTAKSVGGRHGKPFILKINAEQMYNDGYKFFLSESNIWLTDHVPVQYFSIE